MKMTKKEIENLYLNIDLFDFLDILKANNIINEQEMKIILNECEYFEEDYDITKSKTLDDLLNKLLKESE